MQFVSVFPGSLSAEGGRRQEEDGVLQQHALREKGSFPNPCFGVSESVEPFGETHVSPPRFCCVFGVKQTDKQTDIQTDMQTDMHADAKSAAPLLQVSSAADCLAFMQGGCELKKIRPSSRVYCRFYMLDPDLSCLRWEPSKKDGDRARLDVSSMREVRTGKSTETFLHNGPLFEHLPEEAAFSIIHGDDYQVRRDPLQGRTQQASSKTPCSLQSLDLVALSADVANIWVTGLRYLLAHPSIIGGAGVGSLEGGPGDGGIAAVEGSLGSKMRRDWLKTEFAEVDEDGYGIVSEDVAVATICKLCPGIREAKVSEGGYSIHNAADVWHAYMSDVRGAEEEIGNPQSEARQSVQTHV